MNVRIVFVINPFLETSYIAEIRKKLTYPFFAPQNLDLNPIKTPKNELTHTFTSTTYTPAHNR